MDELDKRLLKKRKAKWTNTVPVEYGGEVLYLSLEHYAGLCAIVGRMGVENIHDAISRSIDIAIEDVKTKGPSVLSEKPKMPRFQK
jgi:hypothetical protein